MGDWGVPHPQLWKFTKMDSKIVCSFLNVYTKYRYTVTRYRVKTVWVFLFYIKHLCSLRNGHDTCEIQLPFGGNLTVVEWSC